MKNNHEILRIRGGGRSVRKKRKVNSRCKLCNKFVPTGTLICKNCQTSEESEGDQLNSEGIEVYEQELTQHQEDENNIMKCVNCHRQSCEEMQVEYYQLGKEEINFRRKYSNIREEEILDDEKKLFCKECGIYVYKTHKIQLYRNWKYIWPSYIWRLLTNENICNAIGVEIWRWIPLSLRSSLIESKNEMSEQLRHVTIENPRSYFRDCTKEMEQCKEILKEMKLSELMKMCNKHCACDVRCPFGCTCHLFKTGSMSYTAVMRKFIGHIGIDVYGNTDVTHAMSSEEYIEKVIKSPRMDYLTLEDKVFNKWDIRPCVMVSKEEGICVLTCEDHNGGFGKRMLHPPLNPVNRHFPQPMSDQLSHAVVCPRVVKPMKEHRFSTSYQMHEIRGSYRGLDTCDVQGYGKFGKKSYLNESNECLALYGREDTKCLLNQNGEDGKWPMDLVKYLMSQSNVIGEKYKEEMEESLMGSTYVSLRQCLNINKMMKYQWQTRDINENESGEIEETIFSPSWPCALSEVKKYKDQSNIGMMYIPTYKNFKEDGRLLWSIISLMISVNTLYECIVCSVSSKNKWHGYALAYLKKNV